MLNSKLGIGPLSSEIIEATFRYSHFHRKELMLISSKNQIDYSGGYVNSWKTKQYVEFIREMRKKYAHSQVKLCRDHCGPGFNGIYDLGDSYKTIKEDISCGFDLIHIDLCHLRGDKSKILYESKKMIEYCLRLNPKILIEVGTDENTGANYNLPNLDEIKREISFFKNFCNPEFFVVQTGSLVKEMNQVGTFNKVFVEKVSKLIKENKMKLKEHNADYLDKEEIKKREGIVDAMNIAPQLGAVQTSIIIKECLIHGINFNDFLEEVYSAKKWNKWVKQENQNNKMLCFLVSGHYHFSSESYKKIVSQLEKIEDIKEILINGVMEVIEQYDRQ